MKIKKAFTLAEVLVTLGIIGVVAALTIPNLIQNHQKHVTVNRLKDTYSIISQAVRMSENDNGALEDWYIPTATSNANADCYTYGKQFFEQYLQPYLKIVKDGTTSECFASTYEYTSGRILQFTNYTPYSLVLTNGVVIGFYTRGTFLTIYVDLNGKKGPNKIGRDFFDINICKTPRNDDYGIIEKSGVFMFGHGKSRSDLTSKTSYQCSNNKSAKHGGSYCGELIMLDGWKISDDYPW